MSLTHSKITAGAIRRFYIASIVEMRDGQIFRGAPGATLTDLSRKPLRIDRDLPDGTYRVVDAGDHYSLEPYHDITLATVEQITADKITTERVSIRTY